jgi:hypothetical protein
MSFLTSCDDSSTDEEALSESSRCCSRYQAIKFDESKYGGDLESSKHASSKFGSYLQIDSDTLAITVA